MTCPRWWLSWYESAEDYRPLTFPPNEAIIGWWKSGEDLGSGNATLVALVEAPNEKGAWEAVEKDWPGAKRVRFCNYVDRTFRPSNRFPLSDWMENRIAIGRP